MALLCMAVRSDRSSSSKPSILLTRPFSRKKDIPTRKIPSGRPRGTPCSLPEENLAVKELLSTLARRDPRQAELLRFATFGRLTIEEIVTVVGALLRPSRGKQTSQTGLVGTQDRNIRTPHLRVKAGNPYLASLFRCPFSCLDVALV